MNKKNPPKTKPTAAAAPEGNRANEKKNTKKLMFFSFKDQFIKETRLFVL
jgi:hypothetical protein